MKIYLSIVLSFCGVTTVAQEINRDTVKAKDLNDVVVTGQYTPQSLKSSVYNVRTITAQKIQLRAATNIQQVLNTELGFRFTNDLALGISDVQLMGMTGRNVKILLDGVPMVDRSDGRESLNQIDINTVDRIEIVEGPMSVTYGTDVLAGVINIITKNAGKSSLTVSARTQEETVGKEYDFLNGKGNHLQNLSATWQNKGWTAMAGFTHNDFGGWNYGPNSTPKAEVDAFLLAGNRWKPKEQWLGNTKIGYKNKDFTIWYRLDGLLENIETSGGMINYKAFLQTYRTNRYTNQLQSEWTISPALQLTAIAGYTDLERSTISVIHDFTNNTEALSTDAGTQDVAKFNSIIFRGTLQYMLNDVFSFQPGFEFNRDAATGQRINGSPVINDYALFISSEIKPTKGINIRPGLRFIKNSVYNAPPVTPSLNTKFSLTDQLDLRLAYARGFRSPALRELYYDFVDASHNILGNPNLKAEESNSFNGSLAWSAIQKRDMVFRSTLTGFYNLFINRIAFAQSTIDPSITSLFNVSKYKTAGGTLDNVFTYKNLNANLGISYIGRYNQLLETDNTLDIPEFNWATEISASVMYTLPKIGANISLFYKYTGSLPSYQLSTTEGLKLTKVGSFNLADLTLNKSLFNYLTLNAGVKNLFNVTQLSNTSTASGGAHSTGGDVPFSYGRSYLVGLTFNWNKK